MRVLVEASKACIVSSLSARLLRVLRDAALVRNDKFGL